LLTGNSFEALSSKPERHHRRGHRRRAKGLDHAERDVLGLASARTLDLLEDALQRRLALSPTSWLAVWATVLLSTNGSHGNPPVIEFLPARSVVALQEEP